MKVNIRQIQKNDAFQFYQLIEKNKNHLITSFPKTIERIIDIKSTNQFIDEKLNQEISKKGFYFIIEINKNLVGIISLRDIDPTLKTSEIAYFIDKSNEGKGIVTKAIQEIINFGFKDLKLKKIYAKISPNNIGSQKTILKNRFTKISKQQNESLNENVSLEDLDYFEILNNF